MRACADCARALQVVYLTTDAPAVELRRERAASRAPGGPPAFAAATSAPFVPPFADAVARWKHYLFRAFASRHVLALTAAAGTPAEHAALAAFHHALPGLLARVCRRGGLGGAPVPLSDEDAALVAEIDRALLCVAPCGHAAHACVWCALCRALARAHALCVQGRQGASAVWSVP